MAVNYEDKVWRGISIKSGQILTGRKKLAEKTGLSEQKIRTCLDNLKSTNEITIKTTTKYSMISIVNWDYYQDSNQQDTQRSTSNLTNDQPLLKKIRSKEDKKVKINGYTVDFLKFWGMYPNKKAKPQAFKSFEKALKKSPIEDILLGLEKYLKHKEDWRAWQHPATWLNGEGWNDEYETVKTGRKRL